MFRLDKKIKISLGFLLAAAPVATVIACTTTPWAEEDKVTKELWEKITSEVAKKSYERAWMIKVWENRTKKEFKIDQLLKQTNFKKLIAYYISNELHKNGNFLNEIGEKLAGIVDSENQENIYNLDFLSEIGLLKQYNHGFENQYLHDTVKIKHPLTGTDINQKRIEWIADILMKETRLDFGNEILKFFIVNEYLKMNKEEFETFKNARDERKYNFNNIENAIVEGENFLLIKYLLKSRLFFKWEVSEETESKNFLQHEKVDLANAIKQFILSKEGEEATTLADFSKYTTKEQKIIKELWDLNAGIKAINGTSIDFEKLVGYLGISAQEKGSGKLDFDSLAELIKIKSSEEWFGFLQGGKENKEIKTEDINLVLDGSKGQLKLIVGIMPISNKENKLTMDGTIFENKLEHLSWLIHSNNKDIFEEAVDYFAGDKGGLDIKLEPEKDFDASIGAVLKHLKEQLKIKYIRYN